jgi:Platelet-activating factor acetylhydrolase, isoform II
MRGLEIGFVAVWLLVWLAYGRWRAQKWWNAALQIPALAAVLHLFLEGGRWQLIPAYIGVLLFGVMVVLRRNIVRPRSGIRVLGVISAMGLVIGVLLAVLFPVPVMPPLTGPYRVGTLSLRLTDTARDEVFTDAPDDKRTLMVQIWYPADVPAGAPLAPFVARADVMGPAIARWVRLPEFAFNHVGLMRSNSVADAPVRAGSDAYPVLLYSHGWGGFRQINATQSEALASHGYVVVSMDHPYGALGVAFDDGGVVLNKRSLLSPSGSPEYGPASQLLEEVFARDGQFVLDQLKRLNTSDPRFAGRLDLSRTGIFGHSTGGGAMVKLCARDSRCKALLGQDAWVEPVPDEVIVAGLAQPAMFIRSEEWTGNKNDGRLLKLIDASSGPRYRLSIKGSRHYDFVMIPLFSPLAPLLGLKGPIPAERVLPLIDEVMLSFFDTYLKNKPAAAIDTAAGRWDEVAYEKR